MVIEVKNLGVIAKGTVDTAKPLILMCGPNSTGKTYLSYLIYAICSNSSFSFPDKRRFDSSHIEKSLAENNEYNLTLDDINNFLKVKTDYYKTHLHDIFSLAEDESRKLSRNFSLSLSVDKNFFDSVIRKEKENILCVDFSGHEHPTRRIYGLSKAAHSNLIRFKSESNGPTNFKDIRNRTDLIEGILESCASAPISAANMLTVERNSIYTFNKELSLSRQSAAEHMSMLLDGKLLEDFRNLKKNVKTRPRPMIQRYPLPITASLNIANDLEYIQKQRSPYYEFGVQLERELLNGKISVNSNGSVEFMPAAAPSSANAPELPVHLSSSIVKTLSSLIIFLKHIAKKGQLLIIDEPEMNLHPDNQIILTRIFAKLVNKGLRLIVSTHSDYIIREFNNLVMACESTRANADSGKLPECISSIYQSDEMISHDLLEPLYFGFNKEGKVNVSKVPIDKFGFNVESIDNAIELQNHITQNLYDLLTYGECDD